MGKVANAISQFEKTKMIVHPKDSASAKSLLSEKIDIIEFPINDAWSRDSGAIFLLDHNHGLAGWIQILIVGVTKKIMSLTIK